MTVRLLLTPTLALAAASFGNTPAGAPIACQMLRLGGVSQPALELTIVDGATRESLPARVLVRDQAGRDHVAAGDVEVPIGKDRWFASNGRSRIELPPGAVMIRVERGPEYRPLKHAVIIEPGRTVRHEVALQRWINLRALGYRGGENHVHVPVSRLAPVLAAEDLDFGSSLHWWNGPKLELPPGPQPFRLLAFGRREISISVFDTEVENAWGALYLIGLLKPTALAWHSGRANVAFAQEARRSGALIAYQAGWSREVLVDALLGLVDVVNVCNNNFHRYKYQPRAQYSNLLQVSGLPAYPNTPEGMLRMNTDTYYRLLNCGLRLAAGAGSAIGAKTTPAGYNRVYVRTENQATLREFLESWRNGRNFVTNGPMVFLTADGDRAPGDTIALPGTGGTLNVRAKAISDQPLRTLEIIVNGEVAAAARIDAGQTESSLAVNLSIIQGSWICARATAEDGFLTDDELSRYLDPSGPPGGQVPTRLRFGHTSPVYVTVGGAHAHVRRSLDEARRMLDCFEGFARQTASDAFVKEILDAVRVARDKLGSIASGDEQR